MVSYFIKASQDSRADFTIGFASKDIIAPAYPNVERTYINFADISVSGCNLFYIATEEGAEIFRFWQKVQHDRKSPRKLARHIGLGIFLRYLSGRLTLDGAFTYGSKRLGVDIKPILLPFANAAIDVDKPSDHALVETILSAPNS